MPFTPAHVAAVLPLRGRWGLPFAALAAGSMSPDLPYFLPFTLTRAATHSIWSVPLAVMIGAATHVAWDSFTHTGYPGSSFATLAATYPSSAGP